MPAYLKAIIGAIKIKKTGGSMNVPKLAYWLDLL